MKHDTPPEPRRLARAFAADRKPARPALSVLELVLPPCWGDFLGGSWIFHAALTVYTSYVPGYSHARTHQLLERFVEWLHARGHVDAWQRRVLASRIDEMRASHGAPRAGAEHVSDVTLGRFERGRLAKAFAAELGDHELRSIVPSLVDLLVYQLQDQLGPCDAPPLGSLDADDLIGRILASHEPVYAHTDRALFATAAAFFRWLGERDHLHPARAGAIASRFAAAALGLVA